MDMPFPTEDKTPVPPERVRKEIIGQYTSILLKKSEQGDELLKQIFDYAELEVTNEIEADDPYVDQLLGFDTMPRILHNFIRPLGQSSESLHKIIFKTARNNEYSEDFSDLDRRVAPFIEAEPELAIAKYRPDFFYKGDPVENKYSASNGEGKKAQGLGAKLLRLAGHNPRMPMSRPCQNAQYYANAGWFVTIGKETYRWIHQETGLDVREILHEVANNPQIAALRNANRDAMYVREADRIAKLLEIHGHRLEKANPQAFARIRAAA